MMHHSVNTIDSPQFINLQPLDLNPLMSQCEIKVLYLGENRNRSFISKQVATEMSKTLRGSPIVGYFKSQKEDFADHGHAMIIDDEGIKFECRTVPYGFVAPDAKVWFQMFDEEDDFGNSIKREYLMTTGYLWTGQFEQCKLAVSEGRAQSMELDEKTLEGKWSVNSKNGMEFFIINDAVFSKLCILGNDVEPCFEGAAVTAPSVSKNFSYDQSFTQTLFSMMEDLKNVINEGGAQPMDENNALESTTTEPDFTEAEQVVETNESENSVEDTSMTPEFQKKEEAEDQKKQDEQDEKKDQSQDDEDDEKAKKYSLMEEQLANLKTTNENLKNAYSILEKECQDLRAYKLSIEDGKKDALINEFYMLSDDDKKDVIENKSKYTYEEIESKLCVMCVRKGLSFNKEDNDTNEEDPITTFNLAGSSDDTVPPFISALRNTQKNRV